MKPERKQALERMMKLPGNMLKFPINVMASSMEAMTESFHEIQALSRSPRDEDESEEDSEESPLRVGEASRFVLVPFFEMLKLPRTVLTSGVKTCADTMKEIREELDQEDVEEGEEAPEVVGQDPAPPAPKNTDQEKRLLLEEGGEEGRTTLWQIGRAGRSEFPGKWKPVFDYHVGTEVDALNTPSLPHLISPEGGKRTIGATERLNLHFELEREYRKGELAFIYDRWGAESDQVLVDGNLLTAVSGAGEGKYKHVALSLKGFSKGKHIISITTSGETGERGHRIDFVKLAAREEPVHETAES